MMAINTVRSHDGTAIAFDRIGTGPALILVDGALCHRQFGPSGPLAKLLAADFTVFTYDRRGRGASGDTPPYAVDREVEDIAALIAAAGGPAFVVGVSSGAALALEAANRGLAIRKLAMYESPFIVDNTRTPIGEGYLPQLKQMIAEDRRGAAVQHLMRAVQVPAAVIFMMRFMPAWKKLKAVAPTLVMDGGKSAAWMRNAQRALASVVPAATTRTLDGQTHMVNPKVLAPVVTEFFLGT